MRALHFVVAATLGGACGLPTLPSDLATSDPTAAPSCAVTDDRSTFFCQDIAANGLCCMEVNYIFTCAQSCSPAPRQPRRLFLQLTHQLPRGLPTATAPGQQIPRRADSSAVWSMATEAH